MNDVNYIEFSYLFHESYNSMKFKGIFLAFTFLFSLKLSFTRYFISILVLKYSKEMR